VLLLHGLSDGPYSMLALSKALHRAGYWVVGLRVPGHGTAPSGLKTVTWADMAAAVQLAMRHLEARLGKAPIHIVGYSNGAALAVDYALRVIEGSAAPAAHSLILISPAIAVSPAAALAKWQARLATLPGLGKMAWTAILPEFDPYKYNSFAVNAGQLVYRLTSSLKARIEARAAGGPMDDFPPVLVFLSTVDATVSADAVVDNLLEHLSPGPSELVLFDLNRSVAVTSLIVTDPGPLTQRLLANEALPFALTLVTNENPESVAVVSRQKPALSAVVTDTPLGLSWPQGVLSLSHVALPFSLEDPLYGETRPANRDTLYLGRLPIQAERGLLLFSADWLLRIRHNPFYAFLEQRTLDWLEAAPALEVSEPQLERTEEGP
jgi:pimeloyl-ACP methyl ester carboxylesterase